MIAADRPVQRPTDARLLVVDAGGGIVHARRAKLIDFLRPGDLLVANDAATLPASLRGVHRRTGAGIEVRLSGGPSSRLEGVTTFTAVVFGAGDFRTRTEDRPLPPMLEAGDRLEFNSLAGTIERVLHPRLIVLPFDGSADELWAGLARDGRPIQYAHMPVPLELWDVWTPIAARPVAFEAPSASFTVDWQLIHDSRERGVEFATVRVAAGISSTGDAELDARLPFDEAYHIPQRTAAAILAHKATSGRVVAVGTTVVRALEHSAAMHGEVKSGDGLATGRIDAGSTLRVVDAIVSGTHEPGVSHYELLRAFADDDTLAAATARLEDLRYRTHEFGDSIFVVRRRKVEGGRRTAAADRTRNPSAQSKTRKTRTTHRE